MKRSSGFTLVELLVTLSLMTVVFGITAAIFYGGSGVWQRIRCGVQQEHEIYWAFEQMRRGLHEYHPFERIAFKGQTDKMEFPALIEAEDMKSGTWIREPGRRAFYFDRAKNRLCQSEQSFRGLRSRRASDECSVLAENVHSVKFSYQIYRENSRSTAWQSVWGEKGVPLMVKMDWEYSEACSETKMKKQFYVAIPVGSVG